MKSVLVKDEILRNLKSVSTVTDVEKSGKKRNKMASPNVEIETMDWERVAQSLAEEMDKIVEENKRLRNTKRNQRRELKMLHRKHAAIMEFARNTVPGQQHQWFAEWNKDHGKISALERHIKELQARLDGLSK